MLLRSVGLLPYAEMNISGTIGWRNVRFVPGTNIPDRAQLTDIPSSFYASANRQPQMDCSRSGSERNNAAADFSYRK